MIKVCLQHKKDKLFINLNILKLAKFLSLKALDWLDEPLQSIERKSQGRQHSSHFHPLSCSSQAMCYILCLNAVLCCVIICAHTSSLRGRADRCSQC